MAPADGLFPPSLELQLGEEGIHMLDSYQTSHMMAYKIFSFYPKSLPASDSGNLSPLDPMWGDRSLTARLIDLD